MNNENTEMLEKMKKLMISISKQGIILNPSEQRIIAKRETFDECLIRVMKYDTRNIVERNGRYLDELNKENIKILQKKEHAVKNNSNLNAKEIWKRPEVINELSKFDEYYKNYVYASQILLYQNYGGEASSVLKKKKLPPKFQLHYKCFDTYDYEFSLLEMIIEYLNNLLCKCGYHKDKNVAKTCSGIHDVSHMIYATYCHYFVSCDSGLVERANAIYEYLGLEVKAIAVEDFRNKFQI